LRSRGARRRGLAVPVGAGVVAPIALVEPHLIRADDAVDVGVVLRRCVDDERAVVRGIVRRRATEEQVVGDETASLFAANAARLRKHAPYFIVMGILLGVLVNTHMFGGGEATSFIIAKGQYANAAQVDFYRALGFIPLIVTTAVASGAFQIVGFTLIYPVAYLLPNPILAGLAGGALFGVEVMILSYITRGLSALRVVRDASDNIRNAINLTLEIAILFGSIAAGNAMAGGVGLAVVGGLYALNEALGRPVIRMAAGPVAVILAGIVFNILAYIHLFTPIAVK